MGCYKQRQKSVRRKAFEAMKNAHDHEPVRIPDRNRKRPLGRDGPGGAGFEEKMLFPVLERRGFLTLFNSKSPIKKPTTSA
ncbi:hypothetical protein CDAR_423171 [Caerostris darwini]|uniref:Uncharacterized protein n=1 Tax=Caerostris darwini TaxID=1538125 RepID=A0AAV4UQP2_9ARAC|nr:hypothetical protein CDAR_423171 [Caerostris darwini]